MLFDPEIVLGQKLCLHVEVRITIFYSLLNVLQQKDSVVLNYSFKQNQHKLRLRYSKVIQQTKYHSSLNRINQQLLKQRSTRIHCDDKLFCFCGMVDRRKAFSLISNRDHCQRSSASQISDTPRTGFESVQSLSLGFVQLSCAVVITTTPWRHTV